MIDRQNDLVNRNSPLMVAQRYADNKSGVNVEYAQGAHICDYPYGQNPGFPNMPCDKAGDTSQIAEAVTVAKNANIAVLFLGSDQTTEAENFDRDSIGLAGNGAQEALLRAVLEVQVQLIVVH